MNSIPPCFGYMTEIAGFLDMSARACKRLMRTGGGPLAGEQVDRAKAARVEPEEKAKMILLHEEGKSLATIASLLNRSITSVSRTTREYREAKGMVIRKPQWGPLKRQRYD